MVDGDGCEGIQGPHGPCVQTTKYGESNYEDNTSCTITNPPYGSIYVYSFEVEAPWKGNCWADYLTVNGARYCGTDSPMGVVPNGSPIEWHTDITLTKAGWKICFGNPP